MWVPTSTAQGIGIHEHGRWLPDGAHRTIRLGGLDLNEVRNRIELSRLDQARRRASQTF
jgi:hypothetical protein